MESKNNPEVGSLNLHPATMVGVVGFLCGALVFVRVGCNLGNFFALYVVTAAKNYFTQLAPFDPMGNTLKG